MRGHRGIASLLTTLVILVCCGCARAAATVSTARVEPAPTPAAARPRQRPRPRPQRPQQPTAQQNLATAMAPVTEQAGSAVAVAVDDLSTGTTADYNGSQEFVTASVVKVDILATLLYQLQQADQEITPDEQELAATMIENSDNDSASDLYADVGGAPAIDDANQVFGLTETTVGTDGYWGLTTTTALDQIQLLRVVCTSPSPLWTSSQDYLQGLMSQVEPDQQWGIPAASDPGTPFLVKNGWLPNPTLWEINSIGEIVHDGQHLLIAVLSSGNASAAAGIALVQAVAAKAAEAMAG
ncbi:MAG TPA: serine hydrolase [Streptosporangiaceae bacterium]|nr:serine hydrolase [Streptosporangiaceae bacterium]